MGSFGLSQRRASGLVEMCRNTFRYQARSDYDEELRHEEAEGTEREEEAVWLRQAASISQERGTGGQS